VVVGPGAVGGTVAARLAMSDHDVTVVARGAHLEAIRAAGLELRDPAGSTIVRLAAVATVAEVAWTDDDVVLLAVKSQETAGVLAQLALLAPTLPVVCVQNGVHNELEAMRYFERVYGVVVMCPTVHLQPGVVVAHSHPVPGILDIGRFPTGVDDTSGEVAAAFTTAGFDARSIDDVARWKWAKLITNLGNAVEAVCGPVTRAGRLGSMASDEGRAALAAADITYATAPEERQRRAGILELRPVDGGRRPGGSTWQSLRRGASTETDFINGEIVRLARLQGRAAPVNDLLQRLVRQLAAAGAPPGSVTETDVIGMLAQHQPGAATADVLSR